MTYFTKLAIILGLFLTAVITHAKTLSVNELDQNAFNFMQDEQKVPDGFLAVDFLKTTKRQKYYMIDKYIDTESNAGVQK